MQSHEQGSEQGKQYMRERCSVLSVCQPAESTPVFRRLQETEREEVWLLGVHVSRIESRPSAAAGWEVLESSHQIKEQAQGC